MKMTNFAKMSGGGGVIYTPASKGFFNRKQGGGKKKTTKGWTRLFASAIAALFAFAAAAKAAVALAFALFAVMPAAAANYFWTGESGEGNFRANKNWVDDSGTKLGSSGADGIFSHNAYFFPTYNTKTAFNTLFANDGYRVKFNAALTGLGKIFFKNAGTADAPIVLYSNGAAANGLTVKTSWTFSDNSGHSYVTFQSGTFGGGSWTIGGTDHATEGHLAISNGVKISTSNTFALNNGSVFVAGSLTANQILMGGASGRTATLTIEGGTVTNASGACYVCNASGATGTLYLNEGGTLVTRNVFGYSGGTATVVFNGGTLKAKSAYADYGGLLGQANAMTVTVGEKGGTIDCGGFNVLISSALGTSGDAGGMTFKGGNNNTITLNAAVNYTGKTTLELGTTLKFASSDEIALGGGLVVAVPEPTPEYDTEFTVLTLDSGTVPESVITGAVVPKGSALKLVDDGKSLVCTFRKPCGVVVIVR